jgi:hypothetical protein
VLQHDPPAGLRKVSIHKKASADLLQKFKFAADFAQDASR